MSDNRFYSLVCRNWGLLNFVHQTNINSFGFLRSHFIPRRKKKPRIVPSQNLSLKESNTIKFRIFTIAISNRRQTTAFFDCMHRAHRATVLNHHHVLILHAILRYSQ